MKGAHMVKSKKSTKSLHPSIQYTVVQSTYKAEWRMRTFIAQPD